MDDEISPEEQEFWEKFDAAVEKAGRPQAEKICNRAQEQYNCDLPLSTVKDWLAKKRIPRSDTKFDIFIKVLNAEKHCDWKLLQRAAQTAKEQRLKSRKQQPLDATTTTPPREAEPSHQPEPHSEAESSGQPPWIRRRVGILTAVVVLAGLTMAAVWFTAVWLRGPQRQCATVTEKPSAPVYREIGQPPLRWKRYGEQVELYSALERTDSPQGTYRAVFLREGSYGWMLDSHLTPATCNPK